MSIEGVSNIEAFRTPEHKASILRLMGPSRDALVLPMEGYLRWSFYGFFGLVVELKRICQQYRRVIIEQVPYPEPCGGFLMWHFNARNPLVSLLTENPAQCGDVHILYPRFPEELHSPCRKIERVWRGRESDYMLDVEAYNQATTWSWGKDKWATRNHLFRLTQSEAWRGPQYYHLVV